VNGFFPPGNTFWLFLAQILSTHGSCRETLRQAQAWFYAVKHRLISASTSAYCQARQRLPLSWLTILARHLGQKLEQEARPGGWYGRTVKIVDGSSVSMPDTPENQRAFPQPAGQKPGCGFPMARLVAIFSLATGAMVEMIWDSLHSHELHLFHRLWTCLQPQDVVLADRGFCSYAEFWFLRQRAVDCVMRNHQRRRAGLSLVRRLGRGDRLIHWVKTATCPAWLDKVQWRAIPATMLVREIHFEVAVPGFRSQVFTVVTTLLDPHAFPRSSFVDLYRQRWLAELFLRDVKCALKMNPLRCLSPEMVQKELRLYQIAYNLIRALMLKAAVRYRVPRFRLSFTGTISTIRQWAPRLACLPGRKKQRAMLDALLHYLAHDLVPDRPNRVEPRLVKRRPKGYSLLTSPRQMLKALPSPECVN
jgi:hypothetical protein